MPPTSSELKATFKELRRLLKRYQPPLVRRQNDATHFDLWSVKDVEIAGRKHTEVYFAGAIIRESYVGFYYMPVYTRPDLKEFFAPELLALLKGKSCFHIKTLDAHLVRHIKSALAAGYKLYERNGWV